MPRVKDTPCVLLLNINRLLRNLLKIGNLLPVHLNLLVLSLDLLINPLDHVLHYCYLVVLAPDLSLNSLYLVADSLDLDVRLRLDADVRLAASFSLNLLPGVL